MKERACIRCGCTDSRACAGGCSWITRRVDICSACLTPADKPVFQALLSMDQCSDALRSWRVAFPHRAEVRRLLGSGMEALTQQLKEGA